MKVASLLAFAAAYLAILVSPGPGVTALVARVLARGLAGIPAYIAGFVAGALTWFTVAALGLAAVATTFAGLFVAIRYVGAAYLLYLAWKLWNTPARAREAVDASPDRGWRLFLAGLAINLGNPKAIMFFLALLPTVVAVDSLTPAGIAELAAVIVAIVTGVLSGYALLADRARRLFASPRTLRLINRGSGIAMAGAAGTIALR